MTQPIQRKNSEKNIKNSDFIRETQRSFFQSEKNIVLIKIRETKKAKPPNLPSSPGQRYQK